MGPAKTVELIEMPFVGLTLVYPRNHVLDRNQDWTNQFAAMMDMSAIWPFDKLLCTLCFNIIKELIRR